MVVADAILEAGGRPAWLDSAEEAFFNQDPERVVHRLQGDSPNLGPDDLGNTISCDVRLTLYSAQDCEPLGRYLDTGLPKQRSGVGGQEPIIGQSF